MSLRDRWREQRARRRARARESATCRAPAWCCTRGDTVDVGRPAPATRWSTTTEPRPPAGDATRRTPCSGTSPRGGRYVVAAADEATAGPHRGPVAGRGRGRAPCRADPAAGAPGAAPGGGLGGVRRDGRFVVVEKTGPSMLKVSEARSELVVRRTGLERQVLVHREASRCTPTRVVTSHGTGGGEVLTTWRVPPTEVRRWSGDVTLHGGDGRHGGCHPAPRVLQVVRAPAPGQREAGTSRRSSPG